MKPQRVDIIGAGISGLATAYYLAQTLPSLSPVEIHVWEKEAAPGGLAGVFTTPDFTVEKFYHHIFRRDTALQDLISELGLGADLVWRPAATGAYYRQQPFRLASPGDLLRFTPLPFFDRLRLGWLALHARSARDWRRLDDMTAREYIIKVAGKRVYEVAWKPLFHGKFGPAAEQVSAAWLWSKLVDRGGSRNSRGHEVLGYLRGGLGRMFTALVARLREAGHTVNLGQAVRALQGSPERIETIVTEAGAFQTDLVIGCAQLPELAALLPDSATAYRTVLRQIKFLANVCLVLTLKRSLSDFYWTNVTQPDAPFVGLIEQTNWADPAEFNRKHVVYLSAYVSPDDPRMTMTADELAERYLPTIQSMFPAFQPDVIESHALWQARYAQPIVATGYRLLIPQCMSPMSNFLVCTMAQIYPHDRQVSNGVSLARQTAQHARRYLARAVQ
jgi:protoporphyrinogen oxidase